MELPEQKLEAVGDPVRCSGSAATVTECSSPLPPAPNNSDVQGSRSEADGAEHRFRAAPTRRRGTRKQKAEPVTPVAKEGVGGRFDACDKLSLSIYSIIALYEAGELSEGQCVKLMNCGDRVSWRLLREKVLLEMKGILTPDMEHFGWAGWCLSFETMGQATATGDHQHSGPCAPGAKPPSDGDMR